MKVGKSTIIDNKVKEVFKLWKYVEYEEDLIDDNYIDEDLNKLEEDIIVENECGATYLVHTSLTPFISPTTSDMRVQLLTEWFDSNSPSCYSEDEMWDNIEDEFLIVTDKKGMYYILAFGFNA